MTRASSITDASESATAERRVRERRYYLLMALRVICILVAFVIPGWPKWILIGGAVFLPAIAVMIANQKNYHALPDDEWPDPDSTTPVTALNDGPHEVIEGTLADDDLEPPTDPRVNRR